MQNCFEEDVIKVVPEFQLSTGWRNMTIEKQNFTIVVESIQPSTELRIMTIEKNGILQLMYELICPPQNGEI